MVVIPPATIITTNTALQELAASLAQEPLLAVDTESNNVYAYQDQVCLIQLSTRQADYIVDTLLLDDVEPLRPLMADPKIEKVFHAAEYDISCLKRDYEFVFHNIFDTMAAARLCDLGSPSLGTILERYAGVRMDKSHQLDDWGQRPLAAESLHYAQMDTHFLPYLRDELIKELESWGRLEQAREVFEETTLIAPMPLREFDPKGFWRIGDPKRLKRREMLILRQLYLLREEIAREIDLPPYKVLTNNELVALSRPNSNLDDLSDRVVMLYGERILDAIERGRKARRLPRRPPRHRRDALLADRYAALHAWRKEEGFRRGVDSDMIVSKQTLWDLAEQAPQSIEALSQMESLGPWRLAQFGDDILAVLDEYR